MEKKHPIARYAKALMFAAAAAILSSCAEVYDIQECVSAEPYGFWGGLWHGIIAPASFIISLFRDNVAMYAANNAGGWYDFGFVLGAGILFGGGSKASSC
jgi:hypothetical protein